MAVEFEKFEITDQDLEDEFNPNRWRPRLSKNQQIYGIWADPESDEEVNKRPGFSRKNYAAPISFVGGGIQQAGKKVEKPKEEETQDAKSIDSNSSSEEELIPVKYPSRFGKSSQKGNRFGARLVGLRQEDEFGGWENHTKGIGQKLLLQMGYQPGKGLGRDLQGITNPIEAKQRKGRGAIGLYGAEHKTRPKPAAGDEEAEGVEEKRSTKQWKKKPEDSKRKVRYVYKTPEEVIAEGVYSRRLPGDLSQLSKVKVIDLTGPEQRVLSGYHAIHQQHSKPNEQDDDETKDGVKSMTGPLGGGPVRRHFDLHELTHNLDLLLEMTEQDIIRSDRELRHEEDMVINLNYELEKLDAVMKQERKQMTSMEEIMHIVEDLERRTQDGCAQHLTLSDAASTFRRLQVDFYEEYKLFDLANLAVSVVFPLVRERMADWDPLKEPTANVDLFREWKDLLEEAALPKNFDANQMGVYQRLVWEVWMPKIRTTISSWYCRECDPLITLLEDWWPLLPEWVHDNIRDQLIFPRLQQEVDNWDPLSDEMYIHVWLHPWLPLMKEELEPLYAPIRQKLAQAMVNWNPSDDSAIKILKPWIKVFPPGAMEAFVVRNILPKLARYLQEFVINPHQQHLGPWQSVMAWEDLIPLPAMVILLERNFFPKWLLVLCTWLGHNPNYDEITQWFLGWKKMFPENIANHPAVKERFQKALAVMNHAISIVGFQLGAEEHIAYLASLERREANIQRNFDGIAAGIRTGGSSTGSMATIFKDLIEKRAQELGVVFMPVHKQHECKQVHRFGRRLVYIDRGVVFVQNDDGTWKPTSLQMLVEMA